MFHLLTIEDRVRIPPNDFNNEVQTIEDEIEKKYVSKVVLDGGLFIALYDILGTGDSYVYSGDGAAHLMVRFRMVVFKPFKGEIMEGIIKKSTKDLIQISIGFFDEIYLNPFELPIPSKFNEEEGLWYWEYSENELFFESGGKVRFRVEKIEFNPEVSQPAPAPKNLNTDSMDSYTLREYKERQLENERLSQAVKSPLILKASVKDSGLGMIEWWTGQQEQEDDEDNYQDYSGSGQFEDGDINQAQNDDQFDDQLYSSQQKNNGKHQNGNQDQLMDDIHTYRNGNKSNKNINKDYEEEEAEEEAEEEEEEEKENVFDDIEHQDEILEEAEEAEEDDDDEKTVKNKSKSKSKSRDKEKSSKSKKDKKSRKVLQAEEDDDDEEPQDIDDDDDDDEDDSVSKSKRKSSKKESKKDKERKKEKKERKEKKKSKKDKDKKKSSKSSKKSKKSDDEEEFDEEEEVEVDESIEEVSEEEVISKKSSKGRKK